MDIQRKLEILADAAKYDASCACSGGRVRDMLATEEREAKPAPRHAYLESLRRKSKPET
ncbi:MAG: hypothetical protein ACKODH_11145 [Limisphaerales bacterium]